MTCSKDSEVVVMVGFADKFKSLVVQAQKKFMEIQSNEQLKGLVSQVKERVSDSSSIAQTKLEEYKANSEKQRLETAATHNLTAQGLDHEVIASLKTIPEETASYSKAQEQINEQGKRKDSSQNDQDSKLPTWAVAIRLIIETVDRLIWLIVLGIIAAIIGTLVVSQNPKVANPPLPPIVVLPPVPWERVDEAIRSDLKTAHIKAEQFASNKLDVWVDELMVKVDDNFLPWYFGYWNQQVLGVQSLFQTAYRWFNGNALTAEERLNQVVETEFTNRVLQPQIAQLQIQTLTEETLNLYVETLQNKLDITQQRLKVPQAKWQQHLQDIALITRTTEGNRGASLSFKSVGSTAAAGGLVLERVVAKTGAKTFSKVVGKSVGKFTGKTVAKMVGKAGGAAGEAVGEAVAVATAPIVGPIIGIGIVAWDLIDHYQTRKVNEPILRREIKEYLTKMEGSVLNDNSTGIMSTIYDLERQVVKSLPASQNT